MRVLIINNLAAGLRDGMVYDFIRKLASDGDELVIRSTNGQTAIESLLTDVHSFDAVVSAGGDGTTSALCYCLRNSGVPILPLPAGTGNLLTMNLNHPETIPALVEMIRNPLTLDFDIGELNFMENGSLVTRGFMVIAGAGYDAEIMRASGSLKPALGAGSYFAAAISHLNPTYSEFKIQTPESEITAKGIAVLLLNFAKINQDISITHRNNARDGFFEVAILKSHNALALLPTLFAAFLDRSDNSPNRPDALEIHMASSVRIESNPPLYLQHDGEVPDAQTPFSASVLPGAVRLIVSPEAYEKFQVV